jgi:hypothetical protein
MNKTYNVFSNFKQNILKTKFKIIRVIQIIASVIFLFTMTAIET